MTDITAFPTIQRVEEQGVLTITLTATTAVTAGQVVSFADSGVSLAVDKSIAGSDTYPIGVALYDAAAGAKFACAIFGIVYVANADDTTAIDAGHFVETNDCAVGGTVSAVSIAATGGATVTAHHQVVGKAIEDIAGGGTGRILLMPVASVGQANSS